MDEAICKIDKHDGYVIMALTIDSVLVDENEDIKKAFTDLLDAGNKNIILDLAQTFYISSLVLASLVFMQKRALGAGGKLLICNINPRVKEILEVTNLDKVFDIAGDSKDAVGRLSKE
jgi:anti-anti-sigma factor